MCIALIFTSGGRGHRRGYSVHRDLTQRRLVSVWTTMYFDEDDGMTFESDDSEEDLLASLLKKPKMSDEVHGDSSSDYLFVSDPPQEYLCQICMKVLQEPHVTECCGQHFCRACLEKWFEKNRRNKVCPHCRVVDFVHILYKPLQRKINELQVFCSLGCAATLKLEELDSHLSVTSSSGCGYVSILCPNGCGHEGLRMEMDSHLVEECAKREATCSYCDVKMSFDLLADHYGVCEEKKVPCPRNCGEEMRRGDLKTHEGECPDLLMKCPFSDAGCHIELTRKELNEHVEKGTAAHLMNLMSAYNTLRSESDNSKKELQEFKSRVAAEVSIVRDVMEKPKYAVSKSLECIESLLKGYRLDTFDDSITFSVPPKLLPWQSPPFVVSPGYSMCVRLKAKKATKVELLLLSGKMDDQLKWPMEIRKKIKVVIFVHEGVYRKYSTSSHTMTVSPDSLDLHRCMDKEEIPLRSFSMSDEQVVYISIMFGTRKRTLGSPSGLSTFVFGGQPAAVH